MSRRRTRAFTLIELLVVVTVIALLMALMMPALSGARGVARQAVCASNLRQLGLAYYSYAVDAKDRVPPVGSAAIDLFGTRGGTFYHWLGKTGYLGGEEAFQTPGVGGWSYRYAPTYCPAEPGSTRNWDGQRVTHYDSARMAGSFVINHTISRTYYWIGKPAGLPTDHYFRKGFLRGAPEFPPAKARYMIDTPDFGGYWVIPDYDWKIDLPFGADTPDSSYAFRHPGRTLNALYMDNHITPTKHYSETGVEVYQRLWLTLPP